MITANQPLVSSSSSHVQRNRLLNASKQGKVEEVRRLLKLGESVTQRDHKGNTPLHCASTRGHYAVVQLLVENGAPVDLINHSGQSPMDLSTQLEITQFLALAVVQKKEALPNKLDVRDSNDNTPLHLASIHGRLSTVKLLVKREGFVQSRNVSKETSLDLAKCWDQPKVTPIQHNNSWSPPKKEIGSAELDTITLLKRAAAFQPIPLVAPNEWALGTQTSSLRFRSVPSLLSLQNHSKGGNTVDQEGEAYRQFEAAYEAGKAMDQIVSLEKLAELRLEKKDYFGAAHLINGAIAVAARARVEQSHTKLLYQKLIGVEQLFLTKELGFKAANQIHPTNVRNELKKIREGAACRLQQNKPIQEVQGFLTREYKIVLCNLIRECMDLLAKGRPKGFAVMGLGSMARGEMCPYSDVEFAFIVKDPTQQNFAYFRHLSQLLTFKMINIGETKHELIRPKRVNQVMQPAKSLTPTGFSMDIGGLCPEGKKGIYELIGSPEQLANFQTPEWLQQNESEIILVNAMTTASFVMGDPSLITEYEARVKSLLNSDNLRCDRAIELMRGYVTEFTPRLDLEKIDLRGFNVKQELYRLLQSVVSGLALYYGVRENSTLRRLRELEKVRVLSKEGASRLRKAFLIVARLRVETHLFYKREKEVLYYPRGVNDHSAKGLYLISNEIQESLTEVYRTLIPLHKRAKRFVKGERSAFSHCPFYDQEIGRYDDRNREEYKFGRALHLSQCQSALNPNNPIARSFLGRVQSDLGQTGQAVNSFLETDNLFQSCRNGNEDLDVVTNQGHIALAYRMACDYPNARKWHDQLAKVKIVASMNLNNMSMLEYEIGNYRNSEELINKSLSLKRTRAHMALSLSNRGVIYYSQGRYKEAIKEHLISLRLFFELNRNPVHLDIAMVLNNLGLAYFEEFGPISEAFFCIKTASGIREEIFKGALVIDRVASFVNISTLYAETEDYSSALKYLGDSLKLMEEMGKREKNSKNLLLLGKARILNNRGLVYLRMGNFFEAKKDCGQSFDMRCKVFGRESHHPDIASSLWNWGNACAGLKLLDQAVDKLKRAYGMYMKSVGESHPHVQRLKLELHRLKCTSTIRIAG